MIACFKLASLALALTFGLPAGSPALGQAPISMTPEAASAPTLVELAAPDGRRIDVSVWTAAEERGVIVFSHGFGGEPEAYRRILTEWVADGFTVVAPLHVDSQAHPDRAAFNGPTGFMARIADLAVVRGFVRTTRPGRPLIAAGHSYGSLMSLITGGAVTAVGPRGDADVRAVIALSSAGDLPGLVTPQTWAGLTTPTLTVTGDADLVDDYVTDWRSHRSAFDRSPAGGKMLVVYAGGDHNLVRDAEAADFALLVRVTTDFMAAHALDDPEAGARLAALTAPEGVTIERR